MKNIASIAAALRFNVWMVNTIFLTVSIFGANAQAAPTCHPMSVTSCTLPFPSDVFTIEDPTSPTGRYVEYPDEILPNTVRAEMLPSFSPRQIFSGASGFSAAAPIYFELAEAISLESLPLNGGNSFVVFDLGPTSLDDPAYQDDLNARGDRVDIVTHLGKMAIQDTVAIRSHVIEAWPRGRLKYGHRYIAAITKVLKNENQEDLAPAPGLQNIIDNPTPLHENLLELLTEKGYASNNLISLTHFTVRDQDEVITPMRSMMSKTYAQDHPLRDVAISTTDSNSITLTGDVRLTNFRDNDGGLTYNASNSGFAEWVPFLLTIPSTSDLEKHPISIWGHGGLTAKEIRYPLEQNIRLGIATIGIDYPNHGARIDPNDNNGNGYVVTSMNPTKLQYIGLVTQAPLDQMSLLKAINSHLKNTLNNIQHNGLALPELDYDNIVVQGLSFGAMAGSTFAAFAPNIKGAIFENGGSSLVHLLSQSLLWSGGAKESMPQSATGAEIQFIAAMMQHYTDIGDATNFVHLFRNPIEGLKVRPLAFLYSIGDGVTINQTTEALAEIAGLKLVNDVIEPRPHLGNGIDGYDDLGFGLVQNYYGVEDLTLMLDDLKFAEETSATIGGNNPFSGLLDNMPDNLDIFFLSAFLENPEQYPEFNDFFGSAFLGDIEDFGTHFNSNNDRSQQYEKQWLCERLPVSETVCAETSSTNTDSSVDNTNTQRELYPDPSGGSINLTLLLLIIGYNLSRTLKYQPLKKRI